MYEKNKRVLNTVCMYEISLKLYYLLCLKLFYSIHAHVGEPEI